MSAVVEYTGPVPNCEDAFTYALWRADVEASPEIDTEIYVSDAIITRDFH